MKTDLNVITYLHVNIKTARIVDVLGLSFLLRSAVVTSTCRVLKIDTDDSYRLYLDGSKINGLIYNDKFNGSFVDQYPADSVSLPYTTKVIAVEGSNAKSYGGILASTDDGYILTNSSWKCTDNRVIGWQKVGFDDSLWPPANQTITRPFTQGIRSDAFWIWTTKYYYGDSDVFCRLNL